MATNSFLYKIKKNFHYSNGFFNKIKISIKNFSFLKTPKEMKIICNFTDSCIYIDNQKPGQINKLYGVYCLHPYYESARFGWRSNGLNRIEIFSFVHSNSIKDLILSVINGRPKFEYTKMIDCKISENVHMHLATKNDKYIFKYFDDNGNYATSIIKRKSGLRFPFWFRLFPYFGGKLKAPHDIKIMITDFN